jgi:hypothetical protein
VQITKAIIKKGRKKKFASCANIEKIKIKDDNHIRKRVLNPPMIPKTRIE